MTQNLSESERMRNLMNSLNEEMTKSQKNKDTKSNRDKFNDMISDGSWKKMFPDRKSAPTYDMYLDKINEGAKPDYADIDGDGDEKESMKKAAKDKEEKVDEKVSPDPKTEADMMREWANSIYKQYDSREHYHEQPPGETVDLSLRRYLNADPMKVKIEEDHTEEGMLKEYRNHKGK